MRKPKPPSTKAAPAPRARRLLPPFMVLRMTRGLAPHDVRLNDLRWLIGEALRRVDERAGLDALRSLPLDRPPSGGPWGLPSEIARHARDKLRACEDLLGPAVWPILRRIVLEGGGVHECRGFAPEYATPWRADAVIMDRLRVGLDRIGGLLNLTEDQT